MRSWKLFTIIGLVAVGALTWCVWFFVTSGDPHARRLARLTTGIESIHRIELELNGDKKYSTSAAEDIDAFVSALTAATQDVEPVPPGTVLDLAVHHSLQLTYLDGQEREIVVMGTGWWFYQGVDPPELIDFHGDALEAFIRRMESASQSPADNG